MNIQDLINAAYYASQRQNKGGGKVYAMAQQVANCVMRGENPGVLACASLGQAEQFLDLVKEILRENGFVPQNRSYEPESGPREPLILTGEVYTPESDDEQDFGEFVLRALSRVDRL